MRKDYLNKATDKLIEGIVKEEINLPDDSVIMDAELMIDMFTKKRLELLRLIQTRSPKSISELVVITNRTKQAINRDIKILSGHDLIEVRKVGRKVVPRIKKKLLIFDLDFV